MPERMFVAYWVWGIGGLMQLASLGLVIHRRLCPTPAVHFINGKWYDAEYLPTRKA